ncbi:MAG: tyrosine-type recombinase/integrase [bacterium]
MDYPRGCLYQRSKTKYWWAKITPYKGANPIYESTMRTQKSNARRWLDQRLKDFTMDLGNTKPERVTFDELCEDIKTDYRIRGMKSQDRLERSIKNLQKMFAGMYATEINTARIKRYIDLRMNEEASNGTINRELSALGKMFTLGAECTPPKVLKDKVPHIRKLKEANPRTGFFEYAELQAVLSELPQFYHGPVIFAYETGWRQSEVFKLQWENVNLIEKTVTLDVGTTKNNEGRVIFMTETMRTLIQAQWEQRGSSGRFSPYVFPNESRTNRIIKETFCRAWKKACRKAGYPGKLFHDLRRTAVRNMVRAGIPERVAMMISGHKTRSIFDRYNIVDTKDLVLAAKRIEAYHEKSVTLPVTPKIVNMPERNKKGC